MPNPLQTQQQTEPFDIYRLDLCAQQLTHGYIEVDEQRMMHDIECVDSFLGENTREMLGLTTVSECDATQKNEDTQFEEDKIKREEEEKTEREVFTRDYELDRLSCDTPSLPARGTIADKSLKPEFVVCASFFDPETQKVLTITKEQMNNFFCKTKSKLTNKQIKQAFSSLLKEQEDLKTRAFNYLEPFLRQNYVNNVLLVNQDEFNLQLLLAEKDLKAFSDNNHILETFLMFHEGATLELLPFSCVLGTFLYHIKDEQRALAFSKDQELKDQVGMFASSLTQTIETNKDAFLKTLEKFYSASGKRINLCTVAIQAYSVRACDMHNLEDVTFRFSGKKMGKRLTISCINFNSFEDSKTISENAVFQTMCVIINRHNLQKKQILFCIELVFLNSMPQLSDLVIEKQLYYIRSSCFSFHKIKAPFNGKDLVKHNVAANWSTLYSDLLAELKNKFSEHEELPIFYDSYGLLMKEENLQQIVPFGQSLQFRFLKQMYLDTHIAEERRQEIQRQNFVTTQELSVSFLMQNFLFANKFPIMVTAKDTCLAQQSTRILKNLANIFNGVHLQTEFVLLNGFLCRLEPFEVLIAVAFDGLGVKEIMETVVAVKSFAIDFLVENNVLKEIENVFGERCSDLIGQQFAYHNDRKRVRKPRGNAPFYYCLRGSVNKEQTLNCSANWSNLLNFDSSFEGVCVFKLALCQKSTLCCLLFSNKNKYVYRLFSKEITNNIRIRQRLIEELEDLFANKKAKKRKKSAPYTLRKHEPKAVTWKKCEPTTVSKIKALIK